MRVIARVEQIEVTRTPDGQERTSREHRTANRRLLRLTSIGSVGAGDHMRVVVHDISSTGMLLETGPGVIQEGDDLQVDLPEAGAVGARVVWTSGTFSGCQFTNTLPTTVLSASLLKSDPAANSDFRGSQDPRAAVPTQVGPDLNLSSALLLALGGWACIGAIAAAVWLFS